MTKLLRMVLGMLVALMATLICIPAAKGQPFTLKFLTNSFISFNPDATPYGLVGISNRLYVARATDGFRIYDVTNPAQPVSIGHWTPSFNDGPTYFLAIAGHYAFVSGGLTINTLDIADPANITQVGSISTGESSLCDLVLVSNYLYFVGYPGIQIYDTSDPANLELVKALNDSVVPRQIIVTNHYAYLAEATGLRIYDVSNPTNPVTVGHFATNNAWGVGIYSNYAILATDNSSIPVLNIANPANPVLAFATSSENQNEAVYVSGHYACVSGQGFFYSLYVHDLSGLPGSITNVLSTLAGSSPHRMLVNDQYFYHGDNFGLRIFGIVPQVDIQAGAAGTATLSWPDIAPFAVQQTHDPGSGVWSNTPAPIASGVGFRTLPAPGTNTYYRLHSYYP